jgi:uncharacterized membrane protein
MSLATAAVPRRKEQSTMSTASHSIEVDAPAERAYALWRDFENWPKFIPHLKSALDTGDRTAICKVATPLGTRECHTRFVNEHPGQGFEWTTTDGDVDFRGRVAFESLGANRTRVDVNMEYHAPMGKLGEALAAWLHEDPCADLPSELQRFKHLVEGGEAATA